MTTELLIAQVVADAGVSGIGAFDWIVKDLLNLVSRTRFRRQNDSSVNLHADKYQVVLLNHSNLISG